MTTTIDGSEPNPPNSQANLFGNNGAVIISIDSYVRSNLFQASTASPITVGNMFRNGTSVSTFFEPSASYNPYGTEYLESINQVPIVDSINSLRSKGFSDGDIVTILTLNPSLAFSQSSSLVAEVSGVLELLIDKLGMRKYDARKVIRSNPKCLRVGGAKNARQIVYFLSHAGVSDKWLKR